MIPERRKLSGELHSSLLTEALKPQHSKEEPNPNPVIFLSWESGEGKATKNQRKSIRKKSCREGAPEIGKRVLSCLQLSSDEWMHLRKLPHVGKRTTRKEQADNSWGSNGWGQFLFPGVKVAIGRVFRRVFPQQGVKTSTNLKAALVLTASLKRIKTVS